MKGRRHSLRATRSAVTALVFVIGLFASTPISRNPIPTLSIENHRLSGLLGAVNDDQIVNFGFLSDQNQAFEAVGWHNREETFVWSGAGRHEVWFRIDQALWGTPISGMLTVRLSGYVPTEDSGPRNVSASILPESALRAFTVPVDPVDFQLPFDGVFYDKIVLVLEVHDALRPRDFGSTDGRVLGVQLLSARLQLGPATP